MIGLGTLEWIKLAIYYASYLYFIAAPLCLWLVVTGPPARRIAAGLFLAAISALAYARFIEPRILLTAEHDVELPGCFERAGKARIAVFSDIHIGLFGNALPARRVVGAVNAADPDVVLIAGDYVYFLHPDRFAEAFAALARLKAPAFAVLGNHDLGLPGPDLGGALGKALPRLGLHLVDDRALKLSNSRFEIELVGLSDAWTDNQKLSLLESQAGAPRIVLTHNPQTARELRRGRKADLLVAGHTHGGQIQLPFITCWWTGLCGKNVAYGLREEKDALIFTTSGTGMVGLPMRFRVPPRIDVLNVAYKSCAPA